VNDYNKVRRVLIDFFGVRSLYPNGFVVEVVNAKIRLLVVVEFVHVVELYELDEKVVNADLEQDNVDEVHPMGLLAEEPFDLYYPHNKMLLNVLNEDFDYHLMVNDHFEELFF
jgi:hypothetical protein